MRQHFLFSSVCYLLAWEEAFFWKPSKTMLLSAHSATADCDTSSCSEFVVTSTSTNESLCYSSGPPLRKARAHVCQDSQKDGSASLGPTVGNRLATELTKNHFSFCLNLNTFAYLSTMVSCLLVRGLICVCVSMCVHMCLCLTVSLFFSSNLLCMAKCQKNCMH